MASEDIPVSIAVSSPIQTDPFENADTQFIFGNEDNPSQSGTNAPDESSTATAATAQGGTASSGSGAQALGAPSTSSSSGLSIWIILALAGGAIFLIHKFVKH
jgi:hypothetical protein